MNVLAGLTSEEFQDLTEVMFEKYGEPFRIRKVRDFDRRKVVTMETKRGKEVRMTIKKEGR